MGRENRGLVYTNTSSRAPWRATEGVVAWNEPPAFASMPGFCMGQVAIDILHTWHLGVARDVCGTAMKLMCRNKAFFPASTIALRLHMMMRELRTYAKEQGRQLSFDRLKKTMLSWSNKKCPELKVSGADAFTCVAYLASKLQEQNVSAPFQGLAVAVWAANYFMLVLMSGNQFLSQEECTNIYTVGWLFVTSWAKLATIAHGRSEQLFKLRPKWHYLAHVLLDISSRESRRNPAWDACFLEEDFVKWNLRMFRKMAKTTACENLRKRSLVQIRSRLLEAR